MRQLKLALLGRFDWRGLGTEQLSRIYGPGCCRGTALPGRRSLPKRLRRMLWGVIGSKQMKNVA